MYKLQFNKPCSSFREIRESIADDELDYWQFYKYCKAILNEEGIRNDTIHKVKGLEFDVVILNKVNENKIPRQKLLSREGWIYEELTPESIERARPVIYVGCSRPRKKLIINHNWKPSMFVKILK